MTVILRGVPGLTARELLDALVDVAGADQVVTSNGGFAVTEQTAHRFLTTYLNVVTPEPRPATPARSRASRKRQS